MRTTSPRPRPTSSRCAMPRTRRPIRTTASMTSSRPLRILVAFGSLSGNTRDLARQVRIHCEAAGHTVSWIEAGVHALADAGDPHHDLYLLGSWTDNAGRTPSEMKAMIAALVEAVGKPPRLAVFGTGETQW